jgi:hypothetical protein
VEATRGSFCTLIGVRTREYLIHYRVPYFLAFV